MLGPAATHYTLLEEGRRAVPVVQRLLELAGAWSICWPADSSPESVSVFAGSVLDFTRDARRFRTEDGCGFVGGRSPEVSYNAKSFCRAMLLKLERHSPDVCGRLLLAQILEWTPDQRSLTEQVAWMSGEQVTSTFACSPLLLGCWACLLNTIPSDTRSEALKWDCAKLMGIYRDYELRHSDEPVGATDPEYPPGPRILAELYQEKHECELG